MIPNKEIYKAKSERHKANIRGRWNYLAVKTLSALLREITFKHNDGFYCLNYLHSFTTKEKLESHKKYVKIKIFVV